MSVRPQTPRVAFPPGTTAANVTEDDNPALSPTTNSAGVKDDTGGWAELLKHSTNFDDKTLKDWQGELANLLTFTGLLSAVVTGFLVLSLPKLQEDPQDRAVALLGQISLQLSSHTIANNLINSTIQPSSTPPAFVPNGKDVQINRLWISSLTLSLMAAFWTITVQQWLRHIPLPQEPTAREALRLRQLRSDGLLTWKVPTIVPLLPLAVQISVVLFMTGLLLLLRETDRVVADTFAVLSGVLFSTFVITIPLPLIFPACPYKTPLLPTLWTILNLIIAPVIIMCTGIVMASVLLFCGIPLVVFALPYVKNVPNIVALNARLSFHVKQTRVYLGWLVRLIFFDNTPHVFWRLRELWSIRRSTQRRGEFDSSAIAATPLVVPRTERRQMISCLCSLPEKLRIKTAMRWVWRDLGVGRSALICWPSGAIPAIFAGGLEKLDGQALLALQPVLKAALPDT